MVESWNEESLLFEENLCACDSERGTKRQGKSLMKRGGELGVWRERI